MQLLPHVLNRRLRILDTLSIWLLYWLRRYGRPPVKRLNKVLTAGTQIKTNGLERSHNRHRRIGILMKRLEKR